MKHIVLFGLVALGMIGCQTKRASETKQWDNQWDPWRNGSENTQDPAGDGRNAVRLDGDFKLYADVNPAINPGCNLYTALALHTVGEGTEALLSERLEGVCELMISPSERNYQLSVETDSCNIRTMRGLRYNSGGMEERIEITDYRATFCELNFSALIMVREMNSRGEITLFSYDAEPIEIQQLVQPTVAKLYPSPNHQVSSYCDNHTVIVMKNGFQGPEALVTNRLIGTCEINVLPNDRLFMLQVAPDGYCGEVNLTGHRVGDNGELETIEIIDNRANTCSASPKFVITESTSQGSFTKYTLGSGYVANP
jgi:hypothetical protein